MEGIHCLHSRPDIKPVGQTLFCNEAGIRSDLDVYIKNDPDADKKPYLCDIGSTTEPSVLNHIQIDDTKQELIKCSYEASDQSVLNVHMKNHTEVDERSYQCAHCGHRTKYKWNLTNHIKSKHTRQGLIKCSLCSYKTLTKNKFEIHMAKHLSVDKRPHKCSHCDYRTLTYWNLKVHMVTKHTKQGLVNCSLCNYQAVSEHRLEMHMVKQHRNIDEVSYQCAHCDFRSKYKDSLRNHIQHIHTKQGLYECGLCFYKAVYKSTLARHMARHASPAEKPYRCPHCEYRSGLKYNLMSHIRVKHTRQGLIACSLCDYQASCNYNLERHMCRHIRTDF